MFFAHLLLITRVGYFRIFQAVYHSILRILKSVSITYVYLLMCHIHKLNFACSTLDHWMENWMLIHPLPIRNFISFWDRMCSHQEYVLIFHYCRRAFSSFVRIAYTKKCDMNDKTCSRFRDAAHLYPQMWTQITLIVTSTVCNLLYSVRIFIIISQIKYNCLNLSRSIKVKFSHFLRTIHVLSYLQHIITK